MEKCNLESKWFILKMPILKKVIPMNKAMFDVDAETKIQQLVCCIYFFYHTTMKIHGGIVPPNTNMNNSTYFTSVKVTFS